MFRSVLQTSHLVCSTSSLRLCAWASLSNGLCVWRAVIYPSSSNCYWCNLTTSLTVKGTASQVCSCFKKHSGWWHISVTSVHAWAVLNRIWADQICFWILWIFHEQTASCTFKEVLCRSVLKKTFPFQNASRHMEQPCQFVLTIFRACVWGSLGGMGVSTHAYSAPGDLTL